MTLKAGLAIALLLAATASPAQRAGTRIGRDAQVGNPEDARLAVDILADCVAARTPDWADRWLRLLPGSREEHAMFHRELDNLSACLDSNRLVLDGRVLTLQARSLRRPLALALVKRRLSRAPAQSPMSPESDPWFLAALTILPPTATVDRAALAVQDFGHCVVVNSWAGARALFRSAPDSPEEIAAARMLRPHLGPCLTQGSTVALTAANLRNVLAEPFLHAMAPTP